jgi:hypothetical protein
VADVPSGAYSYTFQGQAQTLDQLFVNDALHGDWVQSAGGPRQRRLARRPRWRWRSRTQRPRPAGGPVLQPGEPLGGRHLRDRGRQRPPSRRLHREAEPATEPGHHRMPGPLRHHRTTGRGLRSPPVVQGGGRWQHHGGPRDPRPGRPPTGARRNLRGGCARHRRCPPRRSAGNRHHRQRVPVRGAPDRRHRPIACRRRTRVPISAATSDATNSTTSNASSRPLSISHTKWGSVIA